MRAALGLSICLVTLLGCASPRPAPTDAAPVAAVKETDDQRAQRLINYSVESGEPINTADGKKMICKQESVTNTRLKNKKICLTAEQWAERTNNAKDGMRQAIIDSQALPPRGN